MGSLIFTWLESLDTTVVREYNDPIEWEKVVTFYFRTLDMIAERLECYERCEDAMQYLKDGLSDALRSAIYELGKPYNKSFEHGIVTALAYGEMLAGINQYITEQKH